MDEENDNRPKQNIRSKCHKPHTTYNLTLETLMKRLVVTLMALSLILTHLLLSLENEFI